MIDHNYVESSIKFDGLYAKRESTEENNHSWNDEDLSRKVRKLYVHINSTDLQEAAGTSKDATYKNISYEATITRHKDIARISNGFTTYCVRSWEPVRVFSKSGHYKKIRRHKSTKCCRAKEFAKKQLKESQLVHNTQSLNAPRRRASRRKPRLLQSRVYAILCKIAERVATTVTLRSMRISRRRAKLEPREQLITNHTIGDHLI